MVKHLVKHGNSYALIIERPILELLGITPETPLAISTDGHTLLIRPLANPQEQDRFQAALEKVNQAHGGALRRLAQ